MPDPNKLMKLEEIGYVVMSCCRICAHGRFAPSSDFGQCAVHSYQHEKHTKERQLSVHQTGNCLSFSINAKKEANLSRSGFLPFLKPVVALEEDS